MARDGLNIVTRLNVGRYVKDADLLPSLVPNFTTRYGEVISIRECLNKGKLRIMVDCIDQAMLNIINESYEQWDPRRFEIHGPLEPGSKDVFPKSFTKLIWAKAYLPTVEVRFSKDEGRSPVVMGFPASQSTMTESSSNLETGESGHAVHPTGPTLSVLEGIRKKPRISRRVDVADQQSTNVDIQQMIRGSADCEEKTANNFEMVNKNLQLASEVGFLKQKVAQLEEAYRKKKEEVKLAGDLNDNLRKEIRRLNNEIDDLLIP